jgi:hypothetical protein
MRPDERRPGQHEPDGVSRPVHSAAMTPPLDADLVELDGELARAAERMNATRARDGRERPTPAFASDLRARLLRAAAAPLQPPVGQGAPDVGTAAPHEALSGVPGRSASSTSSDAAASAPWWATLPGLPALPSSAPAGLQGRVGVRGRLVRRTPTILPAPRWSLLAIAAVLVASLVGLGSERLFPALPPSRATDAVAAFLVRDGTVTPLTADVEILAGDTVRTDRGGRASLQLGGSVVRLAAEAELAVLALGRDVRVDQVTGRAWHRVVVPDGSSYVVITGELRWTALGTAFDLQYEGGRVRQRVRLVAVEHAVRLDGPGVSVRVDQGRAADVHVTGDTPEVAVASVEDADLLDPWLLANARLDRDAGHSVGWLETAALDHTPAPVSATTSAPASSPGPVPSLRPDASAGASAGAAPPSPTQEPTLKPAPLPKPTPAPTPEASKAAPLPTAKPTPTPAPVITSMGLALTSCPGGVLLEWSPYSGSGFKHYGVARGSTSFDIPPGWPLPSPLVGVEGSSLPDLSKTTVIDTALGIGATAWYRAMAFDGTGTTIGASAEKSGVRKPVAVISGFAVTPVAGGANLAWTPFAGPDACFTWYKVTWSTTNPDVSYLGPHEGAWAVEPRTASSTSLSLAPGTYYVRIEAVLRTSTQKLVTARSEVVNVEVLP